MDWWRHGVDLSHITGDWAVHVFREHNTEADQWAAYGAKGRVAEWVYESAFKWDEVTVICGFLDGSCNYKILEQVSQFCSLHKGQGGLCYIRSVGRCRARVL